MDLAWQCRGSETSDAGVHQFAKDMPHNIHQLRKGEHILRSRVFSPRRLRKIEDQLNEPMEIKDATLLKSKQETYSRDTCISRTFIITNDIYHRLEEFRDEFNEIKREQGNIEKSADGRHKEIIKQSNLITTKLSEMDNNIYNYFRVIFILMILLSVLNIALWLIIK